MKVFLKKNVPTKRFLLNTLAFLVILAVWIPGAQSVASDQSVAMTDLPKLKVLRLIPYNGLDMRLKNDKGAILIALEIRPQSTEDQIAGDMITVYRWARDYFADVKCGEGYPKKLCAWGRVYVGLLIPNETTTSTGPATGYLIRVFSMLDQHQIDRLLKQPPTNMTSLQAFHEEAFQQSGDSAGYFYIPGTMPDYHGPDDLILVSK